jgi:hypothetical protein
LPVTTIDSQAGGGRCASDRIISTSSPFFSDQTALWRETENLVPEQFKLGVFKEFLRLIALGNVRDGVAKPGIGTALAGQAFAVGNQAVLVERVRGNAEFGDAVHVEGADLQFDALLLGPDNGGVERAVIVLLGRGDIVLETARHHAPGRMDDAQGAVTILLRLNQDPEAENIGQLFKSDGFALHLGEDRIGPLLPAPYRCLDAGGLHPVLQIGLDGVNIVTGARPQFRQLSRYRLVALRIEHLEGAILQFVAHALHAHAAGQRGVNLHGFLGDPCTFVLAHEFDGPHIVKPVGELDEQDADIVGDGQKQFAEVFRLLGFARDKIELVDLGQALNELGDLGAEQTLDLIAGRAGVLDRVVKKRDDNGGIVKFQPGENAGDFQRVGEIGIAGGARLGAMFLHGIDIGAVEQILVCLRVIGLNPFDEFVLAHHRRLSQLSRPKMSWP